MKIHTHVFCLATLLAASALFAASAGAEETALEIIRKVDLTQMVDTSMSDTTMRTYPSAINNRDYREFRVAGYSRGNEDSYMEFLEPRSIKGLKILTLGDDTWLYFPSTGRVRKIAGKSKGDSVQGVGGDFSYEDLGGGSFETKYDFTLLKEDGKSWTLEGTAKKEDPVYTKIEIQVNKESYLPIKVEFFTPKDGHLKTLELAEVKNLSGRLTPTLMTMTNHKKKSKTVVRTLSAQYSIQIPDRYFNSTQFYK